MPSDPSQPIPLFEPSAKAEAPTDDARPRMPEALPVMLVTVEDARLIAGFGLEVQLDEFYVQLLGFERDAEKLEQIIYRAENFRILFDQVEPPVVRTDMRALGMEVLNLRGTEQKLIDAGLEYLRQKSLNPGHESLLLNDPAGNWIELTEKRQFQ